MYLAENIILLEMPKSGSTYMRRFMDNYFGKENITKKGVHNGISTKKLLDKIQRGDLIVINTIRNPLDWYVSQFAWNTMGKGIYRDIGMRRHEISFEGVKSVIKNPMILLRNITEWEEVFRKSHSEDLFHQYLILLLQEKSHHIDSKYGQLNESLDIGLCTYRFLCINTYNFKNNSAELLRTKQLNDFFEINTFPVRYLKMESLENDLLALAHDVGWNIERVKNIIFEMSKKRYNASKRKDNYMSYYDTDSLNLVKSKDRLIFKLFGYDID